MALISELSGASAGDGHTLDLQGYAFLLFVVERIVSPADVSEHLHSRPT